MPKTDCIQRLRDNRTNCDSIIFTILVKDFIEIARTAYEDKGGIEGQRPKVKTKSGLAIRNRLIEDLTHGAIIPPITVGILSSNEDRERLWRSENASEIIDLLKETPDGSLSIIDGMQRTTALIEALAHDPKIEDREIRVEAWTAESIGGLVYRMLVLNSGQIPWETARQLETIYSQFIKSLKAEIGEDIQLFLRDEGRRRSSPGQFQASTVVRLYLAFSARRAEFDVKDRVAEDFARLDTIETSSHDEFFQYFRRTFELLLLLDKQFSRVQRTDIPYGAKRIRDGREIFKSEPALIGFFVAISLELFDEPGFDIDWTRARERMELVDRSIISLVEKFASFSDDKLEDFLDLDILNERLDVRSGQVGRFERDLFTRAFRLIIDRGNDLPSLRPCWLR